MFIYACRLRIFYILLSRLAGAITRTAPFQTLLGVGSSQTATMLKQPFVAVRTPGDWRDPLSPLGYKFRGASKPLQDLLGA